MDILLRLHQSYLLKLFVCHLLAERLATPWSYSQLQSVRRLVMETSYLFCLGSVAEKG